MRFSDNPKKEGAKCLRRPIGPRDHLDVNLDSYIMGIWHCKSKMSWSMGKWIRSNLIEKLVILDFLFISPWTWEKGLKGPFWLRIRVFVSVVGTHKVEPI